MNVSVFVGMFIGDCCVCPFWVGQQGGVVRRSAVDGVMVVPWVVCGIWNSTYHSIGYGASGLCVEEAYPVANHPLPSEAPVTDPNYFKDTGYVSLENCLRQEIRTVL